jgi:hypothetical protein
VPRERRPQPRTSALDSGVKRPIPCDSLTYVVVELPEAELRRRREQVVRILAGMLRRAAG